MANKSSVISVESKEWLNSWISKRGLWSEYRSVPCLSGSRWGLRAELWVITPSLVCIFSCRVSTMEFKCSGIPWPPPAQGLSLVFYPLCPLHHFCPHCTALGGTWWLFLLSLWTRQGTPAAPRTGAQELLEEGGKAPPAPLLCTTVVMLQKTTNMILK